MAYYISNLLPKFVYENMGQEALENVFRIKATEENRNIEQARKIVTYRKMAEDGFDYGLVLPEHANYVYVAYRWEE
jgi:hypothetical protein